MTPAWTQARTLAETRALPAPASLARLWASGLLLFVWWVALSFAGPAFADPTFPTLSGRVVDQANLLQPATRDALTAKLAALETETGDQLVVVTLNSLQGYEIEDYGYRLGRAWGIGQKETDRGALLIVAPNERKVRIEVGYGLEPVLTDAMSSHIIQTAILPPFREGGFERGIVAGVDAVLTQLRLDPAEAEARVQALTPERPAIPIGPIVLVALVFFFLFIGLVRQSAAGGRRRNSSGGLGPVLVWTALNALASSGRGGGRGGGGFSSGGGFSGGGGSFGGGGASGGW